MEDIDIWRAAERMRKRYGVDAAIHSAMRADAPLAEGDQEGCRVWERIVVAINELDRAPGKADGTH